jgi:hypothetical protein
MCRAIMTLPIIYAMISDITKNADDYEKVGNVRYNDL